MILADAARVGCLAVRGLIALGYHFVTLRPIINTEHDRVAASITYSGDGAPSWETKS